MMFQEMYFDLVVNLGLTERNHPKRSICKVPVNIRKRNEDCYSPCIISIGPIHKENPDLQNMEEAASYLQRKRSPEDPLEVCIKKLIDLDERARWCYSRDLITLDPFDLVKIFLVDGCFMLELFLRKSQDYLKMRTSIQKDPILDDDTMLRQRDLALLENQIPFFVLQTLLQIIDPNKPPSWIIGYTPYFFGLVSGSDQAKVCVDISQETEVEHANSSHLFEILHNYYYPHPKFDAIFGRARSKKSGFSYSAIELSDGGLSPRRASSESGFLDVVFDKQNSVLELPTFPLGEIGNNLMRNFVAFEQCNFARINHVTAYVKLLGSLIRCTEDIKSLKEKQILQLESNCNESILTYFRNICAGIDQKDFYLSDLCEEVDEWGLNFSRSRYWSIYRRGQKSIQLWWQNSVASLKTDYFKDIWKTVSVIAAVVLLLLTGLQTFYTVRSYYPR